MTDPTRYSRLIDGICEVSKVEVPADASIHTRFDVAVKGVAFTLMPTLDTKGDADGMSYFADAGPMPEHRKGAVALQLLETNLFMLGRDSPSFCVDPDSGHIVVAGVMVLDQLTPELTLQAMSFLADSIPEWRRSFLERAEGSAGAADGRAAMTPLQPMRP